MTNEKIEQQPKIENFEKLNINGLNPERSLDLDKEPNAFWLKLEDENFGTVEGKLFKPEENDNNEIIVFGTGTPGGSVRWFEQKFVPNLVENGYSVFVIRHNGADVNYKDNQDRQFINCEERATNPKVAEFKNLGDEQIFSLSDWTQEQAVIMSAFKNYQKEHYVTHSFGGLAFANSIKTIKEQQPELLNEINFGNWVSISGETGKSSEGEVDPNRPFNLNDPEVAQIYLKEFGGKYNMGNEPEKWVNQILQDTIKIRNSFYEKENWFPEKIKTIHLNSDFDPYFSSASGRQIQEITKGLLINDYSIGVSLDKEVVEEIINKNTDLNEEKSKELVEKLMNYKSETNLKKLEETIKKNFAKEEAEKIIKKAKERINLDISDAHEYPQLTPETLLRLIKMKISKKHETITTSPFGKDELSRANK